MGKSRNPTSTSTLDPSSQSFVDEMRSRALSGADRIGNQGSFFTGPLQQTPGEMAQPFFNPFQEQVVDATRAEFDNLRGQASTQARQQATQQGAFGGSRAAVMEGTRLGEIDRAQGSQLANLRNMGFQNAMQQGLGFAELQRSLRERQMQEPIFRQQQMMQLLNMGLGPTGAVNTQEQSSNPLGSAAGGALTGFSAGGPVGALIGGGLGLLGGL